MGRYIRVLGRWGHATPSTIWQSVTHLTYCDVTACINTRLKVYSLGAHLYKMNSITPPTRRGGGRGTTADYHILPTVSQARRHQAVEPIRRCDVLLDTFHIIQLSRSPASQRFSGFSRFAFRAHLFIASRIALEIDCPPAALAHACHSSLGTRIDRRGVRPVAGLPRRFGCSFIPKSYIPKSF